MARALEVVGADEDVREIGGRVGCGDRARARAVGGRSDGFRVTEHGPDGGALAAEAVEVESREGAWAAVRVQQMSCRSASCRPRH